LDHESLKYQIGLTLVKGVGPVLARNLVAYLGGVEAVFKERSVVLQKIPGIGKSVAAQIASQGVLARAEQELKFIEKHRITPLFYTDEGYPSRLHNCDDAPALLYVKGGQNLNVPRIISIVGTRKATEDGKVNCEKLIEALSERLPDVVIVSGLAYGIDICAHRAALKSNMSTVAVLGHGLDRVYPHMHRQAAIEMLDKGGLVTEFISGTDPDKQNFVKRNRIIAGMADVTIVIESGEKGGALITARIASSYNRDVMAFPGRVSDEMTKGNHWLIKRNLAALIEEEADLEYLMNWDPVSVNNKVVQRQLFVNLQSDDEKKIYQQLLQDRENDINTLSVKCGVPISKISAILLNFEFDGLVKSLPGNLYRMI
jgi:DNA processing protein